MGSVLSLLLLRSPRVVVPVLAISVLVHLLTAHIV
jgi:hypothetical protein